MYEHVVDTCQEDFSQFHRNGVQQTTNEFKNGEGVGRVEPVGNHIIEENFPRFWASFNWGKKFGRREIPEEIEYSGRCISL